MICPKCRENLIKYDKIYSCKNGHSFDIAKKGYVNLLLSNDHARHGDDKFMIKARTDFLNTGLYKPLLNTILEYLPKNKTIVDVGCGEGYYTKNFCGNVYGFDISKDAIHIAASDKHTTYAVASSANLPLEDGFADAVVSIFSPIFSNEFKRILKDDGILVTATANINHLFELKKAIYQNPYLNDPEPEEIDGFIKIEEKNVRYMFDVDNISLQNLFKMTPYYYKTSREDQAKLENISNLTITADFLVRKYKKRG